MNTTRKVITAVFIAIAVPTLYALGMRLLFGLNTWGDMFAVMSVSFLFCLPVIVGALTILLSGKQYVKHLAYRIFIPWIPILLFLIITIVLKVEGWACWIMILPWFLAAASVGGVIAGYFKLREINTKLPVSMLVLLPLLISPVETLIGSTPSIFNAYTYIDIDAPADIIWDHVTVVREIAEHEDTGYLNRLLGFPRPIKAELNYEGVGAYREAIFTKGLVFHETVTEYIDNEKMVFTIKAYPHEIPSTTLDEHVVIGGKYFDVLRGSYELEKLDNGMNRLHLTSHFIMTTTFNNYAGWWGRWIMMDIQNSILKVQKKRSENFINHATSPVATPRS